MALKQVLHGSKLFHPLHGALVHFPLGAWALSFIFDWCALFAGVGTAPIFWRASFFLVLLGLLFAVPTALTGLVEWQNVSPKSAVYRVARVHLFLNMGLTILYLFQLLWRELTPEPSLGIASMNTLLFLVLGLSRFLGWKLVYQYRVGVRPDKSSHRGVDRSRPQEPVTPPRAPLVEPW